MENPLRRMSQGAKLIKEYGNKTTHALNAQTATRHLSASHNYTQTPYPLTQTHGVKHHAPLCPRLCRHANPPVTDRRPHII